MKNEELTSLTKREYACIHLGIPESGDEELDALIRKAERKKLKTMILQGIVSNKNYEPIRREHFSNAAEDAIYQADAMLSKLETETDQSEEK